MIYWKFKYLRTQRALAVGVSEEHILVLEVPFKHLELMLGDLIQFNAVYYSARSLDNSNEFVHGIRNISSLQKIN